MLNFKLEERIKQNDYKVANSTIKTLEGTNVKMLFKVQYIIYKPIQTTILEYKVNDINKKSYIIGEEKQKILIKRNKEVFKSVVNI